MPASTARKYEDDPDEPEDLGEGAASRPELAEVEDALDDIDWSELQDFFFSHLRGQFDEMESLLRAGDLVAISRIGHGIKGSGGGVQLPEFTDLGKDLEDSGKSGDAERTRGACQALRAEYLKHHPEDAPDLNPYFS
jgi:HPt (histidine-containing phosphotransfer) domain-containing protein